MTRYTIGARIDNLFTDLIEIILNAGYTKGKEKLPLLEKFSRKFDVLKYFLKLLWEIKALNNTKYITLSDKLDQIGKKLGKWLQFFTLQK
ncbi:MAG: hypothetical protein UV20_C0005G0049 [Candidatus Magasanikbacteria bacterium GW2011_GWA2_42_32]|uniref:S23 ribosomal protein n=1 Tax=Candidatus Magasanikbacteria bacterium GW2011_GWA2_42_32 TaxID=1619039 RepID=A0A0G1A7F8_9BACT|nr:MAG: hypothetical protein UV20_C0005G0049 [Candidatus Magasanikbacteria bacterium GW2011_GWA2_42_32]